MNEKQEAELQNLIELMRRNEAAHDEIGMRAVKQEMDRLLHTPDERSKDNPDKR